MYTDVLGITMKHHEIFQSVISPKVDKNRFVANLQGRLRTPFLITSVAQDHTNQLAIEVASLISVIDRLFALPLHASFRHRVRGVTQRHASTREPTRQACVTTAVVASPRDHARKRAQGATVLTACDNPTRLSLPYAKGGGAPRYFPVSAIIDRCNARNQRGLSSAVSLAIAAPHPPRKAR